MSMRQFAKMFGRVRNTGEDRDMQGQYTQWRGGETLRDFSRRNYEECLFANPEDPSVCMSDGNRVGKVVSAGVVGLINPFAGLAAGVGMQEKERKRQERIARHYEAVVANREKARHEFVQNESLRNTQIGLRSPLMRDERARVRSLPPVRLGGSRPPRSSLPLNSEFRSSDLAVAGLLALGAVAVLK